MIGGGNSNGGGDNDNDVCGSEGVYIIGRVIKVVI